LALAADFSAGRSACAAAAKSQAAICLNEALVGCFNYLSEQFLATVFLDTVFWPL
jgi:hypothetical protein